MQLFNLQTYLLNESLNSTILSLKILNEPSGFFKTFYNPKTIKGTVSSANSKRSVYNDVLDLIRKGNKCIETLFTGKFLTYKIYRDDVIDMYDPEILGKIIKTTKSTGQYYALPDETLIKINKKYNQLITSIQRKCKNLFKRPDGQVITALGQASDKFGNTALKDIQNLTDSNFKTYTLQELRKTKALPEGDVYFWFRKSDNFLLAISDSLAILMDNPLAGVEFYDHYNLHNVLTLPKNIQDRLIKLTIKTSLRSGQILEWPLINFFGAPAQNAYYNTTVYDIIKTWNIDESLPNKWGYNKTKKVGNPTSSASNIRKGIEWGKDSEDYVIVLTYPLSLQNGQKFFNSFQTLDYKTQTVQPAYQNSSTANQYKWKDNDLLLTQPYRINLSIADNRLSIVVKNKETGKLEVRIVTTADKTYNDEQIYFCSDTDRYNEICKSNNINRYKSLTSLIKYKKEVLEILRNIKEEQAIISEIMAEVNRLVREYKKIRKTLSKEQIEDINHSLLFTENNDTLNVSVNKLISIHAQVEIEYDWLLFELKKLEQRVVGNQMDNSSEIRSIERHIDNIKKQYMTTEQIDHISRQVDYVKTLLNIE